MLCISPVLAQRVPSRPCVRVSVGGRLTSTIRASPPQARCRRGLLHTAPWLLNFWGGRSNSIRSRTRPACTHTPPPRCRTSTPCSTKLPFARPWSDPEPPSPPIPCHRESLPCSIAPAPQLRAGCIGRSRWAFFFPFFPTPPLTPSSWIGPLPLLTRPASSMPSPPIRVICGRRRSWPRVPLPRTCWMSSKLGWNPAWMSTCPAGGRLR